MGDPIDKHDHRPRRCPMLGHDVTFAYCRAPGRPLPCRKVFDCWYDTFDVEGFIRAHFSEEDIQQVLAPPKDKMLSLLDLIQRAQKARQDGDEDGGEPGST